MFDSTFTITYALELIAIIDRRAGRGLDADHAIYERQHDMALLALVGATPRLIRADGRDRGRADRRRSASWSASSVGIVLALVLIYVINVQSFGWTIQFHLPLAFLVQSTLLILAATAPAACTRPSRAANIHALQVVREE